MSVVATWTIRRKPDVVPFEARFPEITVGVDLPPYVLLQSVKRGSRAVMWTSTRRGATGNDVWISSDSESGLQDDDSVVKTAASPRQYRLHRLAHDSTQRLILLGLVLALVGIITSVLLDLNDVGKYWQPESLIVFGIKVLSNLVAAAGLVIVFWVGILGDGK